MAKRRNTVVIGAGQNGLATGYRLQKHNVDFVIIDGSARVGDAWRNRWDSLVLFTWAEFNALPGLPFPADRNHLPTKDEAADYCEAYAKKFDLPIDLNVNVKKVERSGDRFVISTDGETYEADNVVIAVGTFQVPNIPAFAKDLDDSIVQMHSNVYRRPSDLPDDGDVLVVGAATSGSQIAMELAQARSGKVYLSGPDVDELPPTKAKILKFLGLVKYAYTRPKDHFLGKKLYEKAMNGGHPLIAFTYKDVIRAGVTRVARTDGVKDGRPLLEGEREPLDVAAIIWSTGFSPDFSWIDLPVFESSGFPRHERGVVAEVPGLYFMGLVFQHTLASQLMMGAGRDSEYIVDALVARNAEHSVSEAAPVAHPATT